MHWGCGTWPMEYAWYTSGCIVLTEATITCLVCEVFVCVCSLKTEVFSESGGVDMAVSGEVWNIALRVEVCGI